MSQHAHAHIVGKVEYRQGDGPTSRIPCGPVEVELTPQDATLSWEDGDTRTSAAMPLSDFKRYGAEGKIVVGDGVKAPPA